MSHQLTELIVHLRTVRGIVQKEGRGQALTQEDEEYLKVRHVTELAKEVIRANL